MKRGAGGLATYSQAGAQFGAGLLWTMAFTTPLMISIHMVSARIGWVTGEGLAANMRKVLPRWLALSVVGLLLLANTLNITADIAAMGEALQLVVGGPEQRQRMNAAQGPERSIAPQPSFARGHLYRTKLDTVMVLGAVIGTTIDFTPLHPIRARVWAAVINGVIAAPIMAVMMMRGARRDVLGARTRVRRMPASALVGPHAAGLRPARVDQSPHGPEQSAEHGQSEQQPAFEMSDPAEDGFGRLAEEPAGARGEQRPQHRSERVERGESQRGDGRPADQHRTGEAKAVGESHADDRQVRIALDESMHALGLPRDCRPTPQDRAAVTAAHPEHQLVARPPRRAGDGNHCAEVQVTAVRRESRQGDDGLAFGEGTQRKQPITVLRDRVRKIHCLKRNVTMW